MKTLAEPQMNATPLIDVLLVLLVMLIFTLPMATHAVKLNLPQRTGAPPSAQAPTVKVIPDKRTRYEQVAQLLAAAQHAGVSSLAVAPIF